MGGKIKIVSAVLAFMVLISAGCIAPYMFGESKQEETRAEDRETRAKERVEARANAKAEALTVTLGDDGIEKGEENWTSFIKASNSRRPADIHIQDASIGRDSLLQYDGEYFHYENVKYKYLLELEGRMPNAAGDSTFVILTDEIYSFNEVVKSIFSSNSNDFLPYQLLFFK